MLAIFLDMVEKSIEVVVVVVVVEEGEGEWDMYLEETCLPFGLLGMVPLEEVNGSSEMAATISETSWEKKKEQLSLSHIASLMRVSVCSSPKSWNVGLVFHSVDQ